jgi:hypothetical protein
VSGLKVGDAEYVVYDDDDTRDVRFERDDSERLHVACSAEGDEVTIWEEEIEAGRRRGRGVRGLPSHARRGRSHFRAALPRGPGPAARGSAELSRRPAT